MSNDNANVQPEKIYLPKLMEWGIINSANYDEKYSNYIPIKRWDPLSTSLIKTKEFGYSESHERYFGHYSYISPIRQSRGTAFKKIDTKQEWKECDENNYETINDVFSFITEAGPINHERGEGYSIIITEDETQKNNPFQDYPTLVQKKIPNTCKALTLINRYPAMCRVINPKIKARIEKTLSKNSKIAMGINLVTISRDFYPALCLHKIPEDVLTSIFCSMKAAINYCIQTAIYEDYYDIPVSPFFNIGSKVGGSQPRIHSQVYIDLVGDGHGSRLENALLAFKDMENKCRLCDTDHEGRTVLSTKYWTFFMTGSPVRNYHLRFHPNEHTRRFSKLNINQYKDLARSLKTIFFALDELKIDRNRNILFNCCPFGYDADFHMYGDIIPHEIIGGAEMADDMRVARKLPEEAAQDIRKIIENKI